MKKNYLNRILSLGLACVMAVSAVGCGKKGGSSNTDDSSVAHDAKQFVYKETDLDLGADVSYDSLSYLGKFGDKFYAAGTSYMTDTPSTAVYIIKQDGTLDKKVEIPLSASSMLSDITIADDGTIYTVESSYGGYDDEAGDVDLNQLLDDSVIIEQADDAGQSTDETSQSDASKEETDVEDIDVEPEADTKEDADTDAEGADDSSSIKGVITPQKPTAHASAGSEDVSDSDDSDDAGDAGDESEGTIDFGGDSEIVTSDDSISLDGGLDDYYYGGSDTYNLVKRNADGTEAWKAQISPKEETETYYMVSNVMVAGDKGIIISDTLGLHLYSFEDGSLVKDIDCSEYFNSEYGNTMQLFKKDNGDIFAALGVDEDYLFYNVDLDGAKITPIENAAVSQYKYTVFSGAGYDLFLSDSEAVYGYNFGDAEPAMLMNFVDSDISSYGLYQLVCISEKSFMCIVPGDEAYSLALMTKVDPKDVKDKKTITLGCNYIDYDVRSHVVQFNKSNDEYRIVINDYSKYDTEDDYTLGATKLSTDIVSGNVPDILVLDNDMPVDSYISKGLFEDMTSYFQNDEELSKINYLDNVMEVLKTDGKMYRLIPSFYVETVATAKEDVGDVTTWTIDDLENLVKKKNVEYKNIFGPLSRDEVFEMALSLSGSQFIDWSKLTCSYNSEAFIHLLELVNEFPEELQEDDYYVDTSAYWREGKAIASRFYLGSFSDYNYEAKGSYGKDIALVGFPSDNGSGSALYPNLQLTMSASSKVKDGCWQFMRYFLSNEYQDTIESSWPMSKDKIDKLAESAKKKPSYIDDLTGKEVEYDDTYYIGESEIIIDPMNDDEINTVLSYLDTVNQVGSYNDAVRNIIFEEAAAFFSGQKTAAEVADIIQSRVQIYVNEIS